MNICVGSMWRDSAAYLDRTLDQMARLAKEFDADGVSVRFVWAENSSEDDTLQRLCEFDAAPTTIIERNDDCPYWPSIDVRERWQHLAWVGNATLEAVTDDDDVFVYVESDLVWEPATILALVDHLDTVDVVSPLSLTPSGSYYDLWGSRGMDGRRFTAQPPHHPDLANADGLVQVQSLAGCTVMKAEVARVTRFDRDDCYRGWNRAMQLAGYDVWCDPSLSVVHP